MAFSDPDRDRAQAEWHSAGRTVKGLVLKLRKFSATTPAGLFAKAVAVSRMGTAAATIAISLADDLVNSAELPRAVWPAADQQRWSEGAMPSRECPCCLGGGKISVCPPLVWIYEEGTERLLWSGDPERLPEIGSFIKLCPASRPPKGKRKYPFIEARRVLGLTHVLVDLDSTAEHRHRIDIVVGALSNSGFDSC